MSRPRLLYQCAKCGQLVHYQYCTEARVHFKCSAGGAAAMQAANKAAMQAANRAARKQTENKSESWSFNCSGVEGVQPAVPVDAPFAVTPEE